MWPMPPCATPIPPNPRLPPPTPPPLKPRPPPPPMRASASTMSSGTMRRRVAAMQRPVLSAGLIGDVAHDLWSADIGILPGLRRPTQYNYRLLYHGFLRTCSGDSCVSELP